MRRARNATRRATIFTRCWAARRSSFATVCKDTPRATDYLKKRGLSDDTALQFGIGYAPDSWNALLKRFGANDAARRKLSAAGLIVERAGPGPAREADGGFYDRFRDRIMFPIRDARGRVIAFGGRIIDSGEPKYMNSPETSVFHKGKELYGLYEARQTRQALTRLLIVEGLHGCRSPSSGRRHVRARDAGHRDDARNTSIGSSA